MGSLPYGCYYVGQLESLAGKNDRVGLVGTELLASLPLLFGKEIKLALKML